MGAMSIAWRVRRTIVRSVRWSIVWTTFCHDLCKNACSDREANTQIHAKNDIRKLQSASLLCISTDLDCKIHNNVLLAVGNYDILNVLLGRYLETHK